MSLTPYLPLRALTCFFWSLIRSTRCLPLASFVITDQTELRKIKCMEKTGISITRELMWWWGVRLATVQELLDLLQGLQLYRAAQVILDCE